MSAVGLVRYNKKRRRLEEVIQGGTSDRVPVALWRHFPVDDQTPEGLAEATLAFQKQFDFDFIKVTPTSSFCLKDWGSKDAWNGATEGTRDYTHRVIVNPQDWEKLPILDPGEGYLGDQINCLQSIKLGLETDPDPAPFIQTIFSPLSQAKNLVGGETLILHLRQNPDLLHKGLNIILESTLRFIEATKGSGISGIFYAVQHANYNLLTEKEYEIFGRPYDLKLLEAVNGLWLNVLHLHGDHVMFDMFADYPVQVINWHDRDTDPDLSAAKTRFPGALCGGLQRHKTMVLGDPDIVTAESKDAIEMTEGKRFILGTGCVLPTIAPRANILASRKVVEV